MDYWPKVPSGVKLNYGGSRGELSFGVSELSLSVKGRLQGFKEIPAQVKTEPKGMATQ